MFCELTRSTFYYFSALADYLGACLQLIFVIFFISQHFKRSSEYTTPYYSMLTIGYTVAFIYAFAAFSFDTFGCNSPNYLYVVSVIEWYFLFLLAFWNFAIGIYRCTAFAIPFKHKMIWIKIKYYMMALIMVFPFIVNGYTFTNFHCKTHTYLEGCETEHISYMLEVVILNSFLSILILILVIFSIFKSRSQTSHFSVNAKIERRLILQTIFSSVFQIFYYFFFTFPPVFCPTTCNLDDLDTFMGISFIFYVCQHYSTMIILLIVSRKIRNDFLDFYKIKWIFDKAAENSKAFFIKSVSNVSTF